VLKKKVLSPRRNIDGNKTFSYEFVMAFVARVLPNVGGGRLLLAPKSNFSPSAKLLAINSPITPAKWISSDNCA
jgi:hypothetical protein